MANDYVSVYHELLQRAPAQDWQKITQVPDLETIGTIETIGTMPHVD
jgi:hypothetical protein